MGKTSGVIKSNDTLRLHNKSGKEVIDIIYQDDDLVAYRNNRFHKNLTKSIGETQSIEKDPFTETIEIANLLQHSPNYTQTGVLNITKGAASIFKGGTYEVGINCNGSAINFSSDFEIARNDYVDLGSPTSKFRFMFALMSDGQIGVSIYFVENEVVEGFLTFEPANITNMSIVDNVATTSTTLWGGYALANETVEYDDEYVECELISASVDRSMLALRDDYTNTHYMGGYDFYVLANGSTYRYGFNSSSNATDTGISVQSGDKMRLRRNQNSVIAEYYRGGEWYLIYNYIGDLVLSGIYYIQISAINESGTVSNMKVIKNV